MSQFFDVTGEWDAWQSNGFTVHFFNMQQSPRADNPSILNLEGRASQNGGVGGRVEGALSETQFNVTVFWENETEGIYEATFGIIGGLPGETGARLNGVTHDAMHPGSVASWHAGEFFIQ
jgi:hypothetical protein